MKSEGEGSSILQQRWCSARKYAADNLHVLERALCVSRARVFVWTGDALVWPSLLCMAFSIAYVPDKVHYRSAEIVSKMAPSFALLAVLLLLEPCPVPLP